MKKIGILGGGQLGRMLLQAAINYPVETYILENDENCPSAHLCHHFTKGDIRNFDAVYNFGKNLDAITIEIENVNVEALEKLESEGVKIYPHPSVLRIIKNKILQKKYYNEQEIPTAGFVITNNRQELNEQVVYLPAVHKLAEGGYDGRGVIILTQDADMEDGFDEPAILEKMVNVEKEISIIVAVNDLGEMAIYPPVEMVFDKDLNQLDYQICPAGVTEKVLWKLEAFARTVVKNFKSPGIFAVELFVDREDEVLVNETAPRVHNSGHHTIEAHFSSQFDMIWRIMLGYPMGNTQLILPSVMVNVIGAERYAGPAVYEGLNEVLKMDHVFLHLYGKAETRPGRKMGHLTIISRDRIDLLHQVNKLKRMVTVKSR